MKTIVHEEWISHTGGANATIQFPDGSIASFGGAQERALIAVHAPRMLRLLLHLEWSETKTVEWEGESIQVLCCPYCRAIGTDDSPKQHRRDCELGNLLRDCGL